MANFEQVGTLIGSKLTEQSSLNTSVEKRGSITTYFLFPNYIIKGKHNYTEIQYRDIDGFFMVGHSLLSEVGAYPVGAPDELWTTVPYYPSQPLTLSFRKEIAKYLAGESFTAPCYGAVGNSSTAYNYTQTALVSELGNRWSTTATASGLTILGFGGVGQVAYNFRMFDFGTPIREIGIFDASSSGNMVVRYVLPSNLVTSALEEYSISIYIQFQDISAGDNMVVNQGLNTIRNKLVSGTTSIPTYTEWSDGTGAMATTDTSLDGSNKQRNAMLNLNVNRPPVPGYDVKYVTELLTTELNGNSLTKSGLFTSASPSATLFAENKFGSISKTSLFKIREEATISIR